MADESSGLSGHSFLRYIGTLSTSAIVLQIGFLEKVFPHPKWKALLAISICGFTAAVVFAVFGEWSLLGLKNARTEGMATFGGCAVILMWVAFLVGLLSGVILALKNLFQL
jgi:hypothetical protein